MNACLQYFDTHECATIAINIGQSPDEITSRLAVLSSPSGNWDQNLIAKGIVTDVLKLQVQRPLEEPPFSIRVGGETAHSEGYVDLRWSNDNSTRIYETRFLVVAIENAPFDVILGRRTACEYGLASPPSS